MDYYKIEILILVFFIIVFIVSLISTIVFSQKKNDATNSQ